MEGEIQVVCPAAADADQRAYQKPMRLTNWQWIFDRHVTKQRMQNVVSSCLQVKGEQHLQTLYCSKLGKWTQGHSFHIGCLKPAAQGINV